MSPPKIHDANTEPRGGKEECGVENSRVWWGKTRGTKIVRANRIRKWLGHFGRALLPLVSPVGSSTECFLFNNSLLFSVPSFSCALQRASVMSGYTRVMLFAG